MRLRRSIAAVLCSLAATAVAHAWQDRRPTPIAIDKTYLVEEPIGKLRVVYARSPQTGGESLRVESAIFRIDVPADALAALPRPDWDRMTVGYFPGMRTDKPDEPMPAYVTLRVPVFGPPGASWRDASVSFTFRAGGSVARRLMRSAEGSTIDKEWPLDSMLAAAALLADTAPATRPAVP